MTYTAGIPKEYKAANQQVLNTLLAGVNRGATQYGGQLSAGTNPLSSRAAGIMQSLMGSGSHQGGGAGGYAPTYTPSLVPGGGGHDKGNGGGGYDNVVVRPVDGWRGNLGDQPGNPSDPANGGGDGSGKRDRPGDPGRRNSAYSTISSILPYLMAQNRR